MTSDILTEALALHEAGISIIPTHPAGPAGDKRPAIPSWKPYQTECATEDQIRAWFEHGQHGIAVICGNVSRGLVMVEIEAQAAPRLTDLEQAATEAGLKDLWGRVTTGWFEKTPSGGYHWYLYAPNNTSGNRKLARTRNHHVLAETRENGGYSLVAPTDGRFHHSGQPWTRLTGGPKTAATLTTTELDDFLSIFRTLDETPAQAAITTPTPVPSKHDGITPGDDYEAKTSWHDILGPHGWVPIGQRGTATMWRRPGKKFGISASTGAAEDRDRLYVWTTSTLFEAEVPYTKFGAYALLEHGGDHSAAAKALHDQGFGKQPEHPRDTTGLDAFIKSLPVLGSPAISTSTPTPVEHTPAPIAQVTEPDVYTRTDDGNALRFADTYAHQLHWIPDQDTWASWNGHKWDAENGDAVAVELAKSLARNLPEEDKLDEQHKRRSLSKNGINNMLALARTISKLYAPLATFDNDPYILNTPQGVVDLRTGKMSAPNPKVRTLRATTVAPDPNNVAPRWHQFLAETFTNDPEIIAYVQRLLGLAVIGEVHEQILPFFHGAGANGKSTMLNVIQALLGIGQGGYTTTIPAEVFLASAANRHPADIASLAGVRIAVTSETEEGQKFAEARVKLLTGSDNISARFMHGNFFTFTPTHTFFLLSNHEPEVNSGGTAFWRRVRKIPFLNIVPASQRDPYLERTLTEEGPGILAWILQGTRGYLADGMHEPEAVKVATREYELDQDTAAQFIAEQCDLGDPNQPHMQIAVAKFYSAYDLWCRRNGLEPIHKNHLGKNLRKHGIETNRGPGGFRMYRGVALKPEWDDTEGHDGDLQPAWGKEGDTK